MRIALDATYSVDRNPSGIAVYSQEILEGLAAAHPDDAFVHYYRPKQYLKSERSRAENVRRRLLLPPWPAYGVDLFHALNQRLDMRPARRVVVTFHDLFVMTADYSSPDFRARFTHQAKRAAERADIIITVSRFTAGQVSTLLGVELSRIRVVPHGVRPPKSAVSAGREKLVLFVGALQARKNLLRLIGAFETLPSDWKIILAGAPNGYRAGEILDRVHASPFRDRITIAGYVTRGQLEELYGRASIFAFPSLDEGFGIPVLEAMAHGVPVLTSNTSGLGEIAADASLIVNPQEAGEIAAGLQRLAFDEGLRNELANRGRHRAAQFPWERSVQETYSVYRELME